MTAATVEVALARGRASVYVERRRDEALEDAARRAAVDAVYAARDAGGTMHDAGALAALAVLEAVRQDDPAAS